LTAADNAPDKITSPAFNEILNSVNLLANHATQYAGSPNAAAPTPVLHIFPFLCKTIPVCFKLYSLTANGLSPSTYKTEEALSAMVSGNFIFQSLTRLSTISKAGTT